MFRRLERWFFTRRSGSAGPHPACRKSLPRVTPPRRNLESRKVWVHEGVPVPNAPRLTQRASCGGVRLLLAALLLTKAVAQTTPTPQQVTPPAEKNPPPKPPDGKVIFSRSTDENGETTTQAAPDRSPAMVSSPMMDDAGRQAVTFTELRHGRALEAARMHQIAVRALVTIRNDGKGAAQAHSLAADCRPR